jgi:hypothetical protein
MSQSPRFEGAIGRFVGAVPWISERKPTRRRSMVIVRCPRLCGECHTQIFAAIHRPVDANSSKLMIVARTARILRDAIACLPPFP